MMKFGQVNHIMLLGGSRIIYELAKYLRDRNLLKYDLFVAPRQLDDPIYENSVTLQQALDTNGIDYHTAEDINTFPEFLQQITPNTIALGLGEAWTFKKEIIEKFNGRLIDLMGIRLPQYRGGAHYTWQILRGNKIGACNLQLINEEMVQGVFDSGEIIKFKEYLFPTGARTPDDYFNHAVKEEIEFIKEFIKEIEQNKTFRSFNLQENFMMYFPRLHTLKNAFINWNWDTADIDKFICAFDAPYAGASTQINGHPVRVKKSRVELNDGPFHPFQCGLIYKIYNSDLYVATKQGTIIISEVNNNDNESVIDTLKNGDRFFTSAEWIEKGMTAKIEY